jgi:hypothetical protein
MEHDADVDRDFKIIIIKEIPPKIRYSGCLTEKKNEECIDKDLKVISVKTTPQETRHTGSLQAIQEDQ